MKRLDPKLQDAIIRQTRGLTPRRRVINVRVLKAQKHKPGHPQFVEYFDHEGKMKREGCCDHTVAVVWIGELPREYAGSVDLDQVSARKIA